MSELAEEMKGLTALKRVKTILYELVSVSVYGKALSEAY